MERVRTTVGPADEVSRELSWPTWSGVLASAAMMGWLTVVLWLDRASAGGSIWQQRGLGALTWGVLLLAAWRVPPMVRVQTAVVVAFATMVDYLFSPTLEVYVYRFHNVPTYVPPGHGLVYLSAYALGHTRFVVRHRRAVTGAVLLTGGAWAVHGWLLADRPDGLGAFWFACLTAFLLWGPSRGVYAGAFVVVSYLELVGTGLRTWTWQSQDPILGVTIGNPPSGAAGGYGWFDLAGLLLAPWLLALLSRRRRPGPLPERPATAAADAR
jgi:hypothetical protein